MYEVDKDFGRLARDILNGRMDEEINVGNINSSGLFYQTMKEFKGIEGYCRTS